MTTSEHSFVRTRPSLSKGFSLTELLVVIAIFIVLAVLTGPVFTDLGKSASLSSAGNQLVSFTDLARQNSMSRNCVTALIVHSDPQLDGARRTYALFELSAPPSGRQAQPSDWKQISKWETLPAGIIADFDYAVYPLDDSKTSPSAAAFPEIQCNGHPISSYRYVLFYPSGGLNRAESVQLRLVEGYLPKEAVEPVFTRKNDDGNPRNFYDMTILSGTGRTKIERPL